MTGRSDITIDAPGTGQGGRGGRPVRRILVPVGLSRGSAETLAVAAQVAGATGGQLRLLHVRLYDPPMPRCPGRFYPYTAAEAAAVLDEAMLTVWGFGVPATSAVVEAPRDELAAAIAAQAAAWSADVIAMTRRPRRAVGVLLLGSVPDQVMRRAACPVLAVHPRPKAPAGFAARRRSSHGRFSRHAHH
jgi:nucleotide-binding universal stress UspA family protein